MSDVLIKAGRPKTSCACTCYISRYYSSAFVVASVFVVAFVRCRIIRSSIPHCISQKVTWRCIPWDSSCACGKWNSTRLRIPQSGKLGSAATYREVCRLVLRRPPLRSLTVITALTVKVTILSHRQLNSLKLPACHHDVTSQQYWIFMWYFCIFMRLEELTAVTINIVGFGAP